ncbi:MAG TPA: enoyl-CoA hydratase/isomerase family protein [Candidatus Baltobacteraceae bacterium]|jgi:enoyl-CoA hydratase/carnithine racemase
MSHGVRIAHESAHPGAVRITLDDVQNANALSPELVAQLDEALQTACGETTRAIVLQSSGTRFCAGFGLADIDQVDDATLAARFVSIETMLERIRRAPALTIALVNGVAMGAGADLVAACDYRIGTERARLGFPGSRFGVILGTRHLSGLIGGQQARETLIEGKILDAHAARANGLLSELCEPERLEARLDEILAKALEFDAETLRTILRLTRQSASGTDMEELQRATARKGLAERMRAHTRKVLPAKAKES